MHGLLLALALLGTGCCLSIAGGEVAGSTGGSGGQATSGQGSGGQATAGGSATTGGCADLTGVASAVVPNVVDFGPTLINTTAMRSVKLENCSTAAVTGITATVTGSDANLFTVDNTPTTLGAGDSATVNISYSPLALETRSLASVTFGGPGGAKVDLTLFGEPIASALTLQPNPCDFGYVAPNTTAICCTTVTNQANLTVDITGVESFDNEGGAFGVASTFPIAIAGGGSAEVCFSFMPPIVQQYSGQVTLETDDPTGTNPIIQLTAWVGGPAISCTPLSVDFGQVADHTTATVPVICTNIGSAIPSTNLVIDPPTASPYVFSTQFDQSNDVYPLNGLAPGQSTQIDVAYAPTTTSNDMGTLFIKNNGGTGQTVQIPLTGQGLNIPPCQFEIAPSRLDFGNLQVGASISLAFDVTNVGNDICLVDGPRVANDATGAFRIVSTSIQPDPTTGRITIPASSILTVTIAFSPDLTGAFSPEILFSISDPTDPNQTVELSGTSEDTCLQVAPTSLDFGQLGMNDAGVIFTSQSQSFTVSNQCRTSASIQGIAIQSGLRDTVPQYSQPAGPTLPASLAAGGKATYDLDCQPTSTGQHPAGLLISDGNFEVLLPMTCDAE